MPALPSILSAYSALHRLDLFGAKLGVLAPRTFERPRVQDAVAEINKMFEETTEIQTTGFEAGLAQLKETVSDI
jgi:hypothetical protein